VTNRLSYSTAKFMITYAFTSPYFELFLYFLPEFCLHLNTRKQKHYTHAHTVIINGDVKVGMALYYQTRRRDRLKIKVICQEVQGTVAEVQANTHQTKSLDASSAEQLFLNFPPLPALRIH
jgi:hypothetical protein